MKPKITAKDYYNFGTTYFGPFLYGFTSWLCSELSSKKIDKVFFFSRDGYMMQKAFHILNTDKTISDSYVYFSRNALRAGLLYDCKNFEESLQYLAWSRFIRFREIMEYYGFSQEETDTISKKHKIDPMQDFPYDEISSNPVLQQIYETYQSDIISRSKDSYEKIRDYLLQISMTGRCAIVDIGWHGNMQIYLNLILEKCGIDADIYGFYVGIQSAESIRNKTFGFLYNNNNLTYRKHALCFFGGYEKLFQSLEGSANGFARERDSIVPVLLPYEYKDDPQLMSYIRTWQKGALDYIEEQGSEEIHDPLSYAIPLMKFGVNPDHKNLQLFYFLYNTDGGKVYYLPQKPLFTYKPKEFIHALSSSVWKTGFMKAAFKLPLPYFKIYQLMRK